MSIPRRFLPPMQVLRAFEACARHASFTSAAKELNLTQSAVSRQVRALEDLLGGELFVREKQSARLTMAGEAYANEVRTVLQRLSSATMGFQANPTGGTLQLAILPTFGTRWLAPRLPDFLGANPGISINLVTRLTQFDFRVDVVDAAIHYGTADWPDADLDFLMPETLIPACSPKFKQHHALLQPEDLLEVPLLHLVSRPDAWEHWFTHYGVQFRHGQGMLIDQFAVATQAAIAGMGVAQLPAFLFQVELARGDLIAAVDAPLTTVEGYYLACSRHRIGYPPLERFRRWLQAQSASMRTA